MRKHQYDNLKLNWSIGCIGLFSILFIRIQNISCSKVKAAPCIIIYTHKWGFVFFCLFFFFRLTLSIVFDFFASLLLFVDTETHANEHHLLIFYSYEFFIISLSPSDSLFRSLPVDSFSLVFRLDYCYDMYAL